MEEKTSFAEKFAKKKSPLEEVKEKKGISELAKKSDDNSDEDNDSKEGFATEKKSFMDHLINSRGDLCYKVTGRDITGRNAWYFILVDKEKKDAFLKHKSGDSYNLEDYGKIIISGYGDSVPPDVQEMLKEKYGFDNF
ncbi:MAG: hypothetical protein SFT90_04680 [Rickettsiales bacterium]|nr:hypothetical protein [Rickettsiales bacterium]